MALAFIVALFLALPLAQAQTASGGIAPPDPVPEFSDTERIAPEGEGQQPNPSINQSLGFGRTTMPDVLYNIAVLPSPVARMRALLIEAAKTGSPEAMRGFIGTGDTATQLDISGENQPDDDPIAYLISQSGDEDGQEILAILLDVLDAGFVHLNIGTEEEMFVWPYFAASPLKALSAPQRVELFRILTAGDLEQMEAFGSYNFYRLGISPEGQWRFFVAGD